MKLEISELSYEAKEYEFEGATLMIRPLIWSRTRLEMRGSNISMNGQDVLDDFLYCLVGWKNVTDSKGKDLPCTDEIKKMVFDFGLGGISGFVLDQARAFQEEKADQEKN